MTDIFQQALPALQVINTLVTWGAAVYVYRNRKTKAENDRLKKMEERLTCIETDLQHLPKKKDTAGLETRIANVGQRLGTLEHTIRSGPPCANHDRMEKNDEQLFNLLRDMTGNLHELSGGMKALKGSVDMINEHLINGGR